jgi:magnesium transporter
MGQLGDLSPEAGIAVRDLPVNILRPITNDVQVGIIVGLLSTSIQSLGLTLQRKSHLVEDAKDPSEARRPAYKRRKWQIGMFMFVISNLVGSTIQITTLPLPVLSTLQASGLVFNTAFATLLLGEPFTRYSLVGTVLTCGGAALIATFGAIGEPAHSLGQLLDLLGRWPFIVWMAATLSVVVGTILIAHFLKLWSSHRHIEHHYLKTEHPPSASSHNINPGALARSFTESLPRPLQIRVNRLRLARGLAYGLVSGILSAHSLLVAKSAVELLVRTIVDRNNQFNQFQSWLILVALLFFALTQLYYLHLGLRLCSTSVLYPFVFCVYNIIAILDGLIYFHQASKLSALHGGLVALGTFILLVGVFALSWRLDEPEHEEPPGAPLDPSTPFTPGMGIMRTSEDESRESLLSRPRSRSSVSAYRPNADEHTPLLSSRRRPRPSTLSFPPPDPEAASSRDIWAEIDDEDHQDNSDFLASLPSASPFLTHKALRASRRRGDSASSQAVSSTTRRSSDGYSKERSPTSMRKASGDASKRQRSASVRFADAPSPSRYDARRSEDTERQEHEAGGQQASEPERDDRT